jgi:hypothetical protein
MKPTDAEIAAKAKELAQKDGNNWIDEEPRRRRARRRRSADDGQRRAPGLFDTRQARAVARAGLGAVVNEGAEMTEPTEDQILLRAKALCLDDGLVWNDGDTDRDVEDGTLCPWSTIPCGWNISTGRKSSWRVCFSRNNDDGFLDASGDLKKEPSGIISGPFR